MTALLLLPLDDRPVNCAVPRQLGAVAGEALVLPPPALLGRFLRPGDADALAAWLSSHLDAARGGILALDMLAYGGLVASRTPVTPVDEALARLAVLRRAKARRPELRLSAFSVIMRLTITGHDAETRAAGRDIFRYSVLRDRAERLGEADAAAELPAVEARIPPALLAAYLAARARNHAVNRAALDLLAAGVLDFLALVQEDTAPAGLHVAEQAALAAYARERVADACWRLYAGTDEAAQTLLARAVLRERGLDWRAHPVHEDPAAAAHPARFEDVPLAETVRRHVDAVGARAGAGTTLAVHTFAPPQPDLFEMAPLPDPTWEAALAAYPPRDGAWLARLPAPLAVADVAYCNGGDPHLLHALLDGGRYTVLHGYAGWNTAGNTLGTALAHAALRAAALAGGVTLAMEAAHRDALFTRLLDDGLYQPIVRGWAAARAQEIGASPLNLRDDAPRVEAWVNAAMQALWRSLCARYPAAAQLDRPFRAVLPWGRLFEVGIAPGT
ncbi:MAG TPA: DUF4127 family protein [Armatimonadota bacterium]|nr:DUF4127 family protein [Armatimonadota bacterium]